MEVAEVARELREFAKSGLRDSGTSHRLRLLNRVPLLRSMSPVRAAGGDSKAQYEYLAQAIIDAIDAIGQVTAVPTLIPPLPVAVREAQALRALFGLGGQGRWKTWRARQEDAAAVLSVSWDYFRHEIQENLLRNVAEQILNINAKRPRQAIMLEFSTATTGSILRALRDVDASIYLLAANPERISGWHESRMRRALNDLMNIDFAAYNKLRVRLYNVPPALRGRRIGDLVVLGWYSHRDNKRLDQFDPASVEVWGHDNAVVAGR